MATKSKAEAPAIAPEYMETFRHLFRGRQGVHGTYKDHADPNKKNVQTHRKDASEREWRNHLAGTGPYLGQVPVDVDNTCLFGAIDIDDDGVDLVMLEVQVKEKKLPLVVCRSKSGGAHLYLFVRDPVPAKMMREKLSACVLALGRTKNHDGRATEIFPKQDRTRPEDVGNWINLPYYNHQDTNRYAVIDGEPVSLERFLDFAMEKRLTSGELEAFAPQGDVFGDGPPCLQTMYQMGPIPSGGRNVVLYNVGVYFKLKFPEDWDTRLRDFNQEHTEKPLPEKEITQTIRSLERKDYAYTCNDVPLVDYCNKSACKKRKYGCDTFRKKELEKNLPPMGGLRKVLTDPPRWVLVVDGLDVDLTTEDLMNQLRFRKVLMERSTLLFPMMKAGEWDDLVRGLLDDVQLVEAPHDAGVSGVFQALVIRFLTFAEKSGAWDDVLAGRPYQPEGENLVYFRSQDLTAFLERQKFREYTPAKVWVELAAMGADRAERKIKGAFTRLWSLPAALMDGVDPTEPLAIPQSTEPTF